MSMRAQPIDGRERNARSWVLAEIGCVALALAACLGPIGTPTNTVGDATTAVPSPTAGPTTAPPGPGLPAGFPLMPGMRADEPLPEDEGLIGRWTTPANGAEVFDFLKTALPRAGYRIDLLGPGDTVAVIRFTPPGGQRLQIDLGQAGSGAGASTFMELRLPRD
jgi:hypothetical protein